MYDYNIFVPFLLGVLSLVVTSLVLYYFWLIKYVAEHHRDRATSAIAVIHIVIMILGLLLTGFVDLP